MRNQRNISALWGYLIIEELIRHGVKHFIISPGSRSTPLVVAAAENPKAEITIYYDERSAGFHALGIAKGSESPACVITTSGTAVANLTPAVVESSVDNVPLIILSADRPPELRSTGANQSIDQIHLFGNYLRWQFDFPVPDDTIPARMVLTTVDHAHAKAVGNKGPIQLNCMYRKPLEPVEIPWDESCLNGLDNWESNNDPFTDYTFSKEKRIRGEVEKWINEAKSGLIIVGSLKSEQDRKAVAELSKLLEWPIYCDVVSGMKMMDRDRHLHCLDHMLVLPEVLNLLQPDTILQFGGRITSKRVLLFLDQVNPDTYLLVDDHTDRLDPSHRVTNRMCMSQVEWVQQFKSASSNANRHPNLDTLIELNELTEKIIIGTMESDGGLSEPYVARCITKIIPDGHALFVSNSMPVRDVEMFSVKRKGNLLTAGNRGASGIDGIISTATGFCRGADRPTTLLLGDLALIHDLNSLILLRELDLPLVIVIINNSGGGIFHFIPISKYENIFSPYFDTPHNLNFVNIVKSFGIDYESVLSCEDFDLVYSSAVESKKLTVIEVLTDKEENLLLHEKIRSEVRTKLERELSLSV